MKISTGEYLQRKEKIQGMLKTEGFDSLIITQEETIYYLTGLTFKSLERFFIIVLTPTHATLVVPQMELAHLRNAIGMDTLISYWEYPAAVGSRWMDVLDKELNGLSRIGVEPRTPIELTHHLSDYDVQPCDAVDRARWIKSPAEIDLVRKAAVYCDKAVARINDRCYYGISELEILGISREIQRQVIIDTEFDYLSSSFLVAVWPGRISYQPHGIPKINDMLKEGSHISLAFLRVNGYAAECERTFFTTKPTVEQQRLFKIMEEARARCFEVLRAGVTGEEVDLAAKEFIIAEGFEKNLMHRTGHGIGLGNHEGPFIAEGADTVLQENMIISIEPGIYVDQLGGFRHSDTVLIKKDGYELLTKAPSLMENLIFTKTKPMHQLKGMIARKLFKLEDL